MMTAPGYFSCLIRLELRAQEIDLDIGDVRPFLAEVGDHAGVLQRVAEQSDDPDERRIQRKVDAGLGHRGPVQRAGLRRDDGRGRAEIALECGQRDRGRLGARHDERVVVAGDGEDRRRVVAERLIELVVVIGRLAEIIDDVAEVKRKAAGSCCAVGRCAVERDLIRHAQLVEIFARIGGARDRRGRGMKCSWPC